MVRVDVDLIKAHLKLAVAFFEQNAAMVNCHTVDYVTKNLYSKCVPATLRCEIATTGMKEVIDRILNNTLTESTHSITAFVEQAKGFSLYRSPLCANYKELSFFAPEQFESSLQLKVFVTEKKSHEVHVMSGVCAALQRLAQTSHTIDVGDGKGYLSSILALQYGTHVLGIDSSETNTENAIKRVDRLDRVWHSLSSNPKRTKPPIGQRNFEWRSRNYRPITQYVTEKSNLDQLVTDTFMEIPQGLSLVGLHTCGNLGSTSVKMFAFNPNIRSLCNVSCCYHFINELFSEDKANCPDTTQIGFPLSAVLTEMKFSIGRQGRMLSCQTIDRLLHNKTLPTKITYYRALLQVLIKEKFGSHDMREMHVGRLKGDCDTFTQYVRHSCKKLKIDMDKTDDELDRIPEQFAVKRLELDLFFLLRSMLAPVIESILLVDRLLYLRELGFDSAELVQLFDPIISPRCYALIAHKGN